jgi:hypothetical protein
MGIGLTRLRNKVNRVKFNDIRQGSDVLTSWLEFCGCACLQRLATQDEMHVRVTYCHVHQTFQGQINHRIAVEGLSYVGLYFQPVLQPTSLVPVVYRFG